MKKFKCGICENLGETYYGTRKSLRQHLKSEHFIKKNISNFPTTNAGKISRRQWSPNENTKQDYWITEEF